jgi:dihydropteroate synthase
MIDVGAESSRPGSEPVDEAEEIRRLMPVLKGVLREVDLPISVDTTKAGVARRALDAGAALINDISALRFDPALGRAVAEAGAGLVLMHMRGTPKTMGQAGGEGDVVAEVREFFRERLRAAAELGVAPARILLDRAENLALIARLDEFRPLGRPLLIGVSRKTFIGELLGRSVGERLMGTAAAVAAAVLRGASIVRVHDVAAMRDVVRLAGAIREAEAGAVG